MRFGEARYVEHWYSNTYEWEMESYYDWTLGYDQAGVLRGYTIDVYDNGTYKYTTTYKQNYLLTDSYLQTTEHATSSTHVRGVSVPQSGSTERVYDANGQMVEFRDTKEPKNNRFLAYNTDGQVVTAVKGTFTTTQQGLQALRNALYRADNEVKAQHYFFANGQQIGSFGQLTNEHNIFEANFDVNFTAVSPGYPTSVPAQVIAQEGETLRLIAMRVLGDANLWYLIAEENGLTDPDAQLTAGMVLQIPNEVISLGNTASSFKPFDISEVIGDTTPTQPAPPPPRKKKGCGVLGAIIVVVVAVIVTIATKGAATKAAAGAINWAFGAGAAASGAGAVAATVIGAGLAAAAGSVVSQGVAIAIGQQDSFSWKQVAAAGLAAGLTQGIGPGLNPFGSEIVQAGINNAIGQGVNIALGLQEEFNWGAVAAAAVAAPIARAAGGAVAGAMADSFSSWVSDFTANLAANGMRQLASVVFNGGRIDYANIFADAFGNALGNSAVERMNSPQARRERWANGEASGGSADRSERAPLVLSGPIFEEPVLNLNPSESGMLVVTTPDEARPPIAGSGGSGSAATVNTPPVVSFDRTRGQWIATYADGTVIGHDGNEWSSEALISGTVTVTGTRYSASETRYYDEHVRGGVTSETAGRIIERQRARDRAIANPANFSRDLRQAADLGISMDELLARRAAALPRELRGAATMMDAGGPIGSNFRRNYYVPEGEASRRYKELLDESITARSGSLIEQIALGQMMHGVGTAAAYEETGRGLANTPYLADQGGQLLAYADMDAPTPSDALFARLDAAQSLWTAGSNMLGAATIGTAGANRLAGVLSNRGTVAEEVASLEALAAPGARGKIAGIDATELAGRLSPEEMASLQSQHGTEFAQIYLTGPGRNGGGGTYYLIQGGEGSVPVPVGPNVRLINHTHPEYLAGRLVPLRASSYDRDFMDLLREAGSPQVRSQIVPERGTPFYFRGNN